MAELGFTLDLDIAANASRGGRISTGVYKVTIEKAFVYKTKRDDNVIDLELRSDNGEVGFINLLCIDKTWSTGAENFDYPRWQELAASAQMRTLTKSPMKRIGKDGEFDAEVINELMGKTIQVAVYNELDVYQNEERSRLKLSNSFLADGRSVAEAQAKKPAERIHKIGERLEDYQTPEYKVWKNGGGTAAIDEVNVADVTGTPEVPVMADAEQEDLFG